MRNEVSAFISRELWQCDIQLTIAMDLLQQVKEKVRFGGHYLRFTGAVQLVVACLQKKEALRQKHQSSANDATETPDDRQSTAVTDILNVIRGWLTLVLENLYGYRYPTIKDEEIQVTVKKTQKHLNNTRFT